MRVETMKIFNINWQDFFEGLEKWQQLDDEARNSYLDNSIFLVFPHEPTIYGEGCASLIKEGFLIRSSNDTRVEMNKNYQPFHQVIRALEEFFTLDFEDIDVCYEYLEYHYSSEELNRIYGTKLISHSTSITAFYNFVSSEGYVDEFLSLQNYQNWEQYRLHRGEKALITNPHILELCQTLVHCLLEEGEWVPFAKLLSRMKEYKKNITQRDLSYALYVCFRYILIIVSMDFDTLEPVVSVWPRILKRKQRSRIANLEPKQVSDSYLQPFSFYDMNLVLEECLFEPIQVRTNDHAIYAKTKKAITKKLMAIPDFIYSNLFIDAPFRVERAKVFLEEFQWIKILGHQEKELRLDVTNQGKEWHEQPLKKRLRMVLDHLEIRKLRVALATGKNQPKETLRYLGYFSNMFDILDDKLKEYLFQCTDLLPADHYISFEEFETYCGVYRNPFLLEKNSFHEAWEWGVSLMPDTLEEKEECWQQIINTFITAYLIYWGGVHLAQDEKGNTLIKKSDIGRYILGEVDDFEFDTPNTHQVVVQPNFEIVFLESSPHAEMALSSFTERTGHNIGSVFQITQFSIRNAVAKGIPLEQILETLNSISTKKIPENVKHEIEVWYKQVRKIRMQNALLIDCPDEETADLVQSIAGNKVQPLNDTILKCSNSHDKKALVKKLKEKGVFVEN